MGESTIDLKEYIVEQTLNNIKVDRSMSDIEKLKYFETSLNESIKKLENLRYSEEMFSTKYINELRYHNSLLSGIENKNTINEGFFDDASYFATDFLNYLTTDIPKAFTSLFMDNVNPNDSIPDISDLIELFLNLAMGIAGTVSNVDSSQDFQKFTRMAEAQYQVIEQLPTTTAREEALADIAIMKIQINYGAIAGLVNLFLGGVSITIPLSVPVTMTLSVLLGILTCILHGICFLYYCLRLGKHLVNDETLDACFAFADIILELASMSESVPIAGLISFNVTKITKAFMYLLRTVFKATAVAAKVINWALMAIISIVSVKYLYDKGGGLPAMYVIATTASIPATLKLKKYFRNEEIEAAKKFIGGNKEFADAAKNAEKEGVVNALYDAFKKLMSIDSTLTQLEMRNTLETWDEILLQGSAALQSNRAVIEQMLNLISLSGKKVDYSDIEAMIKKLQSHEILDEFINGVNLPPVKIKEDGILDTEDYLTIIKDRFPSIGYILEKLYINGKLTTSDGQLAILSAIAIAGDATKKSDLEGTLSKLKAKDDIVGKAKAIENFQRALQDTAIRNTIRSSTKEITEIVKERVLASLTFTDEQLADPAIIKILDNPPIDLINFKSKITKLTNLEALAQRGQNVPRNQKNFVLSDEQIKAANELKQQHDDFIQDLVYATEDGFKLKEIIEELIKFLKSEDFYTKESAKLNAGFKDFLEKYAKDVGYEKAESYIRVKAREFIDYITTRSNWYTAIVSSTDFQRITMGKYSVRIPDLLIYYTILTFYRYIGFNTRVATKAAENYATELSNSLPAELRYLVDRGIYYSKTLLDKIPGP